MSTEKPLVAVIMGSQSDWDTMKHADETLSQFGVAHESRVISAHRSPSLAASATVGGMPLASCATAPPLPP